MSTQSIECYLSHICDSGYKKILEVLSLNVILDQKLKFIYHCALRITLSKKVTELRVITSPKQ